jgi:hypothetical protein
MSASMYQTMEFRPTPERYEIVAKIIRSVARFENIFTDYERACSPICDDVLGCSRCRERLECVSRVLSDPKARVWEVWRVDGEFEVVGIIYLTNVIPGCDALAHYVFFDSDLNGKTELLKELMTWATTDREDWAGLKRITIEIPEYAYALARHAVRKLGFGGDFTYKGKRNRDGIPVEGVKRKAIRWNGQDADVLVLGKVNG